MQENKRIWIVGGSTGIGLELVQLCLESNYYVIASSRNATKNDSLLMLKDEYQEKIKLIDIDVSSKEKIHNCVNEAWNTYEGLDIWFYNAGAYEVMSINEWNIEKFEEMNEVNYLGVIRLMSELLPYFKKQKRGHWVWNSSLSASFGLPQGGGYSAPKAALVNLAQSIQPELDLLKIDLQIINHGFVKTRLTDKNKFEMPQLMQPKFTAEKIFEGIQNPKSFEIRFPFLLASFLSMLKIMPYKMSLYLTKRMIP